MYRKFLTELFGITLIIGVVIYCMLSYDFFISYRYFMWVSLAFLVITTLVVYFIMLRAMEMKEHSNFVVAFATGFGIKSLASLLFLCYFIFYRPIADHTFVFPFFAMYFAYTGLLVWDLWQQSKRKPLP
jgi:hypothetical protein